MLTVEATRPLDHPPEWTLLEQHLFDLESRAIEPFMNKYLTDDDRLYWPQDDDYVGVDGHDDPYEAFYTWPLVYAMGGDKRLLEEAKRGWQAVVDTCSEVETPFGHPMAVDEYEQCRDWFHQGEGNLTLYNIGFADPHDDDFAERAERFAGFYLPESDVDNYDPENRVVRGQQNGSMGPEYANPAAVTDQTTFGGYGSNYRWARHGSPFRDIPELESVEDLQDPENEDIIYDIYEKRCTWGDIPLNLNITSLMTHAYLYTGDQKYREWVTDYVDAWEQRTADNDGIVPDNVGLSGEIGENIDGRWYGAMYGWTWGGFKYTGLGPLISGENSLLLGNDDDPLGMFRSTFDALREQAIGASLPDKYGPPGDYRYNPGDVPREDDGEVLWKDGWYEFRPVKSEFPTHLWYATMDAGDRERMRDVRPVGENERRSVHGYSDYGWLAYLEDEFEAYPSRALETTHVAVQDQIQAIRDDDRDPSEYTENYLHEKNPVKAGALLQLTMGAPPQVYNGGLVMARIRHFDGERREPGLPDGVGALVTDLDAGSVAFRLANIGNEFAEVVVQAGAYGEHTFDTVSVDDSDRTERAADNAIAVHLPQNTAVQLRATVDRFSNDPSYAFPWDRGG